MKASLGAHALVLSLFAVAMAVFLPPPGGTGWKVIGWSRSGMQVIDPDYSVFSIHPPGSDLRAQVITPTGQLLTSAAGLSLTYEAVADVAGSMNRSSSWKSDFWTHAGVLFGAAPAPDVGLSGAAMPGPANTPRPLAFDAGTRSFRVDGVPITGKDDAGLFRPYPMMRLSLRDGGGALLASTDVAVPVSDEWACDVCHASFTGIAEPQGGWVGDGDADRDYRLNILRKHDESSAKSPLYGTTLAQAGYLAAGLEATAVAGTAIRCSKCHASNLYPGSGLPGVKPLTESMHGFHTTIPDPVAGGILELNRRRETCYFCHAGERTGSLRGVMGEAVSATAGREVECQGCHGSMSTLAQPGRAGWQDEPKCQSCHTGTALTNNGQLRYSSAFEANGTVRVAVDQTFATTPNAPSTGLSLYGASTGHGSLACSACHGPAHAEAESAQPNDNVQAESLQGHVGTLAECTACHAADPVTVAGGPHGMHPVGQSWIPRHFLITAAEKQACRHCHGTDYRGTALSRMQADRSLALPWGVVSFPRGAQVGCYSCHQGPNDQTQNPNGRPVAQNAAGSSVGGAPAVVTLVASDAENSPLVYRVVQQPAHGRVGVVGNVATYVPEPGFAGQDRFSYLAWDGSVESNLATVTITRGAEVAEYGTGVAGTNVQTPRLLVSARPVIGTTIDLTLENPVGAPVLCVLLFSTERSSTPIGLGARLLTEPAIVFPFILPSTGQTLPWAVPNDPGLVGVSLFGQYAVQDAAAPFGFGFSRGVRVTIGGI